jgi:hypothetical protein
MQKTAGRFTGGGVPFGYRIEKRDGEQFVVIDTDIQRRVTKLRDQKYSARAMVGALKGAGISVSNVTLSRYLRAFAA